MSTNLMVVWVAALFAAIWITTAVVKGRPRVCGHAEVVMRLTAERDYARLRADMLETVARERWLGRPGKVCTCGLCGATWPLAGPEQHEAACVLHRPPWRAR